MKLIAYRLSNKGIKKYKFYAEERMQGEWTKTGILLLFKVNRERDNLTPESYFDKNPARKAKSGMKMCIFRA